MFVLNFWAIHTVHIWWTYEWVCELFFLLLLIYNIALHFGSCHKNGSFFIYLLSFCKNSNCNSCQYFNWWSAHIMHAYLFIPHCLFIRSIYVAFLLFVYSYFGCFVSIIQWKSCICCTFKLVYLTSVGYIWPSFDTKKQTKPRRNWAKNEFSLDFFVIGKTNGTFLCELRMAIHRINKRLTYRC